MKLEDYGKDIKPIEPRHKALILLSPRRYRELLKLLEEKDIHSELAQALVYCEQVKKGQTVTF